MALEQVDQRGRSNAHRIVDKAIWAVLTAALGFLLAQVGIG